MSTASATDVGEPKWWKTGRLDLATVLLIAAGIILGLALAAYANTGLYTRYWADDFCAAAEVAQNGILGAQIEWYRNWTGEFSFIFFTDLIAWWGLSVTPFVALTVLSVWLVVLSWALSQLCNVIFGRSMLLACILLAEVVIFAYVTEVPNRVHSVYWHSGSVSYTLPLVFFSFFAGFIARSLVKQTKASVGSLFIAFLLTFVAAGFSETFLAWQTAALLLATSGCLLVVRRTRPLLLPLLLSALAGSVVAAVVMIVAPGVDVRESSLPERQPIFDVTSASLEGARVQTLDLFQEPVLLMVGVAVVLLSIAGFALYGSRQTRNVSYPIVEAVGAVILAYALVVVTYFPSHYILGQPPYMRALVTAVLSAILGIAYLGLLTGYIAVRLLSRLKERQRSLAALASAAIFLLLAAATLPSTQAEFARQNDLARYAAAWDARNDQIRNARAAGATAVTTTAIHHEGGLLEPGQNPQFWVNRCMANYYGLESLDATRQ